MKAIVIDEFGGPEKLILRDVEKPAAGPGEVLVKNVYIGVGKPDYLIRSGRCHAYTKLPPNMIVGNECAGIVEAVGQGVEGIVPGNKVSVNNGLECDAYAEYIAVPQRFVTVLPDEFDLKKAPGLLNYVAAYALLNYAGRGTEGHSLYIRGAAGGVGTAIIQTALLQGMEVCASGSTEEKVQYLKNTGAQCVFNYTKEDEKTVILDYTNGRGVDLIYDQSAGERFKSQYAYLAEFGMIVLYNWMAGDPQLDLDTIVKEAWKAHAVRSFSLHIFDEKPEIIHEIRRICVDRLLKGELEPCITAILPLEEARRAHELLDAGKIIGKMLLQP